jgi:ribose transport system ATP-binding protein
MLIGDTPPDSGQILVKGQPAAIRSVHEGLHRYGIGYVSENRKEEGLLLESSVSTNITLTIWQRLRHRFSRRICPIAEQTTALEMVRAFEIRCNGLCQITSSLSGGNQQKICIAKWLVADCDTLVIDEPTVGVDVGAKEQIHRLIWELAGKQNKAIILISSDLPEMISLAHRILVFRDRRIVGEIGEVDASDRSYAEISRTVGHLLN